MPPTELLISAGEASGDMYAARLATALRARADVRLFGMGGPSMREAGVDTVVDSADVALVGLLEVARKMPALNRAWRTLLRETRRRKPALAILTDFPGFHLHLSRALKRMGVRNVYFVCPQFWAWRPRRVNLVCRRFVRGLCIFPFEVDFFRKAGVPTDWIGHPLVDQVHATMTRAEFAARYNLNPQQLIVALLPGSRPGELAQHLPVLMDAAALMQKSGQRQFVLAAAPGLAQAVSPLLRNDVPITIVENATYNALAAADVAIVSSGTATVEAALIGVPMVVIYRVAPLTAWIARRLVRTPFFAMVNLIAEKRIVPELIQDDFTPERVAAEAERMLGSPQARAEMRNDLAIVRDRLGPPGAIERAADIIVQMIGANMIGSPTGGAEPSGK
jgi:lipid-A-disaccharide synthase